ncbi:MAG: DUF4281 domain-containing protein [Chitinophagaceae bacterium]|nr:DUF4281 domain-containing protein [Chitinophagaceae bacterium]
MTPDYLFKLCSSIAMISWILLIILSPFWARIDRFLIGIVITLFAIVYAWLIVQTFSPNDFGKFGTLAGVQELFSNPFMLVAGWVHYLAFDLLTGIWIKKNSIKYGISHWLVVPCLLLTFMLGPVGLLVYLLIRWVASKEYFASNY